MAAEQNLNATERVKEGGLLTSTCTLSAHQGLPSRSDQKHQQHQNLPNMLPVGRLLLESMVSAENRATMLTTVEMIEFPAFLGQLGDCRHPGALACTIHKMLLALKHALLHRMKGDEGLFRERCCHQLVEQHWQLLHMRFRITTDARNALEYQGKSICEVATPSVAPAAGAA